MRSIMRERSSTPAHRMMASEFSRGSPEQPDLFSPLRDLSNLLQCRLDRITKLPPGSLSRPRVYLREDLEHHMRHTLQRNFSYANHRSEEHTSELQSRLHLVCRLLLEKKKKIEQERRADQ